MGAKKPNLLKFHSITNGDMSSATLTSTVTNIQFLDDVGIQFNFSGSPVGELSIEVSADYAQDGMSPPNVTDPGHWVPLTLTYWDAGGSAFVTAFSIPTGVGSPVYVDLALLSAPWIRAKYTKASGTGTLNVFLTAKSL